MSHTPTGRPAGADPAPATSSAGGQSKHTAGAFDIRTFIGSLLGLYGLILTLTGLFGDAELDKTGGVNANLWTGLALLLVGTGFIAWARLRPVIVPSEVEPAPVDPTRPAPRRKR